eukprot:3677519-Rhodomonas_salina.1
MRQNRKSHSRPAPQCEYNPYRTCVAKLTGPSDHRGCDSRGQSGSETTHVSSAHLRKNGG